MLVLTIKPGSLCVSSKGLKYTAIQGWESSEKKPKYNQNTHFPTEGFLI